MKKIICILMTTFVGITAVFAQTVTLTFTGRDANNHFIPFDRVEIGNVTRSWQETIYYPDTVIVMGGTGIEENVFTKGFALAQNNPNPFDVTTNATLTTSEAGEVTMEMLDMNGRMVASQKFGNIQAGVHQFTLTVAVPGTYILTARQNGKTSSIKMVNTGEGAINRVEYAGVSGILQRKSDPKGIITSLFNLGDEMVYIGYVNINGTEYTSQTIHKNQIVSENFILNFNVTAPTGLATVTTDVISNITAISATCGGNVTADSGVTVIARGVCWSTFQNPTVNGNHTINGNGTGSFTSNITGLTSGTIYYIRAYATNIDGTAYGNEVSFTTLSAAVPVVIDPMSCPAAQTATDHEGNVYATVQIGNQCWMRDNLRTTTSPSSGTYLIPSAGTGYTFTGKQARWYNNDSTTYAPMNYGLLYNWNAAMDTFNTAYGETSGNSSESNAVSVTFNGHRRGICPAGWHLPSDAEWNTMEATVSGSDWQSSYETSGGNRGSHAGKLAGGNNWTISYSSGGVPGNYGYADRNASCFSAVPAGRCYGPTFDNAGNNTYFWSSTQSANLPNNVYQRYLSYGSGGVYRTSWQKNPGYSVRCLRDNSGGGSTTTLPSVTTDTVSGITDTSATCGGNVTSDGGFPVTAHGVCWSTFPNPTINDNYTIDGSGTGGFTSSITGLTTNTMYFVRAYATNSVGTAYGNEVRFNAIGGSAPQDGQPCPGTPTVTDHEGNVYNTVQIGNQCWTKENLRTTTSPSTGTYLIPTVNAGTTSTGKQARWYDNDSTTYAPMNYGLLYNWNAAVDTFNTAYGELSVNIYPSNEVSVTFNGHRRGICPAGWHLPSDAEWNTMEANVSGLGWQTSYETSIGGRGTHAGMLSGGGDWATSTMSGSPGDYGNSYRNASFFSAVPAGCCIGPSFYDESLYANFWSSTQDGQSYAYYRHLAYNLSGVYRDNYPKDVGFSVRCLRDY